MAASVSSLISSLKGGISMEVRAAPPSGDYLEGVMTRQQLQPCCALLAGTLGPAAKEFGKPVKLEPNIRKAVGEIGGVRPDQCLYLVPSGTNQMVYAVLWPWASDPNRITLKVGTLSVS